MIKVNTSFILSTIIFQVVLYFLIDTVAKANLSLVPKTTEREYEHLCNKEDDDCIINNM